MRNLDRSSARDRRYLIIFQAKQLDREISCVRRPRFALPLRVIVQGNAFKVEHARGAAVRLLLAVFRTPDRLI